MMWLFNLSNLIVTCGIGMIPRIPAPGTFISLFSIFPWYFLSKLVSWYVLFVLLILIIIIGCYFCHCVNKKIGIHDHKCIVLDEFIGMWFILILSPNINNDNWFSIFIGFLCFRIFDICKPWPISFIDSNVKNGLGIVFDDVLAGVISIIFIFLIYEFFSFFS